MLYIFNSTRLTSVLSNDGYSCISSHVKIFWHVYVLGGVDFVWSWISRELSRTGCGVKQGSMSANAEGVGSRKNSCYLLELVAGGLGRGEEEIDAIRWGTYCNIIVLHASRYISISDYNIVTRRGNSSYHVEAHIVTISCYALDVLLV
jgi:hypothetical protein